MVKGPSNARFEAIFSKGRRANGSTLRVAALFPGTGLIGIATAKKIGSKPHRNRMKRRIREAIRGVDPSKQLDFVLIASVRTYETPFERIREEVGALIREAENRWAEELESS